MIGSDHRGVRMMDSAREGRGEGEGDEASRAGRERARASCRLCGVDYIGGE